MPDSRKNLYDALSNDFDLGTFEEFNSKMDIPESRKKLYESVSVDFDLGTFDEFEAKVGTLKKKEPTYPGLKDAFGISSRGPLMEKSNLQVTTKKEKQPLKSNLKAEELKSIETNLAKENIELSQIKQKLTALEKSGKLQDPTIQAEYNGLVGQYNEKQKAVKGQFDKYHKEHGNYRTIVRDEQNADLKKGINTAKGVLNKINTYDATLKQVGLRYGQTKVALEEAMQAGDNDAAAQLQGQLKKDEAIIANLGELIKTGKKVAAGQEQDSFGNNINIGIYQAFGTILQSPQGLTKAALTPIMEYGMGLDPVQRELMFRTLAQLNPNMMASETLAEFGGEISTKAEGRKQMANMNRLYGGSSYNALMKGDILNAVSYAAKDFANSLPSSTLYATGAGAALMSAGMVGDEIRRTEEETGQAIGSKEILTASVKAGLEVVTERMFGDGKAAVELVKRLGKAGAEKAISDAVKEIARKGLGRKIAEQAGEEVVGESLNQIGANAADIYINGKKDINLWDGVGDAALIALVGGGAYGGALTTASHYIDKARIKEAEDLKSQAANYMEQSMMQQNPAAAEVLEEKANTLNLEAQNIVDKEQEIALNANPETVDAIIALEGLKEQLEEALQEEGLPEEVSVVIEEKLSALQVEHNELIVQATKEAQENIKAEEEEISEPIDVTEFLKGDTKEEDLTRPSVEVVEAPKETPQAGSVGVDLLSTLPSSKDDINNAPVMISDPNNKFGGTKTRYIPFSIIEKANKNDKLGGQTAREIAQRGGYSDRELDKLYPNWRNDIKEASKVESKEESLVEETPALKNVESTSKALDNLLGDNEIEFDKLAELAGEIFPTDVSYAYHKAKEDGSNPELVKAVEELLTNKKETPASESKVGENKYEYDPKAKDSSRDIGSRADDSRAKKSDITAGTNKGESSENVSVPTKKEVVQEEPTKEAAAGSVGVGGDVEVRASVNQKNGLGEKLQDGEKRYDIIKDGIIEGNIIVADKKELGHYEVVSSNVKNQNKGIGTKAYKKLIATLDKPLHSDMARTPQAERLWAKLEKEGLAKKSKDGIVYESLPKEQSLKETPASENKNFKEAQKPLSNSLEGIDFNTFSENTTLSYPQSGYDSEGNALINITIKSKSGAPFAFSFTKKNVNIDDYVKDRNLLFPRQIKESIFNELKKESAKQLLGGQQKVLAEFGDNINEGVTTLENAIKSQIGMESGGFDKPFGVNIWTNKKGEIKYVGNNANRSNGLIQNIFAFDKNGKLLIEKSVIKSKEAQQAVEELLKSKPKEVKSKLTPDQAVSNLEGLKVEVKEKAPEPKVKPKKKRLPSRKAINKLDPTTPSDFIALALANIHISLKSFYDANDRNNIKVEEGKFPYVRLNYLRKNGYSLDKLVTDLANDKVAFPFEMSEDDIRKRIIGFMFDNLNGPNSYAVKMLNIPDAEQEYYDRKQAEFEQMLSEEKEAREAELDAIDTAWSQLENDIETLSEEDIDKILSLMVEEDNENINNIIESNNEKQDIGGEKDGGIVVSENTGSQKDNQGKSKEELEAKVKEKKSAVDKAQNALSKAKANLEKAVSESQRNIFGKAEAENKLFAPDLKALNKVISDKESILALAKESLQKANDELNSWAPKNQTKISFDDTITFLEKLKVDTKNKSFDAVLGIPVGIWNASIDTITLAVKAGVSISDAIKRGLNYIQKNHRGAWDKKGFNQKVLEELGLRGIEVNGEDLIVKPVEKEFASVVNGFYSDIEQSLLDTNKDNLSGKEWISTLGNSDEANWTGLTNWLNSQEGKVSKANIRTFLKENKIEVVEVVKGEEGSFDDGFYVEDKGDTVFVHGRNSNMGDDAAYEIREEDGAWYITDNFEGEDFPEANSKEEALYDIKRRYNDSKNKAEVNTKFPQYQLEGEKENYKEVLVILPSSIKIEKSDDASQRLFSKPYDKLGQNERGIVNMAISEQTRNQNNGKFQSSHFEEKDILVHLRMNTRVDSEGNKVLFLEEVQSDWGQKGKKEGFKEDIKIPENLIRENDKGEWRIANIYDPKVKFKTRQEAENYYRENYKLGATQNIPSAPFVTDTNAWTKLGLKVALKEAVKQGADKIAWSTGTQQFDRWGSEEISWRKNTARTPQEEARMKELGEKIVNYKDTNEERVEHEKLARKEGGFSLLINEQTSGATAFNGQESGNKDDVTIQSKEDLRKAIKKNLSRERNDAEIDKLTDRIWNRMQTEDSGTSLPRKEGMEGFYGVPTEVDLVKVKKSDSKNPSFEDMIDLSLEGGELEIGKVNGAKVYGVTNLKVDENKRKQGIATNLLKRALDETKGELSGMASNDMSVGLNYKLGMRATENGLELSLEETKKARAEKAGNSIRMILPENKRGKNYKPFRSLGIIGNVAKSLFKQEPGTVTIETSKNKPTDYADFNEYSKNTVKVESTEDVKKYSKSGYKFLDASNKVIDKNKAYELIERGQKIKAVAESNSTQHSIDITPELKASVEGGLPLFGNVIQALERLKLDTKGKLNAFGIAPALWNAGIDTIILAIKGGTELAEAVQRGIEYFKEKGAKFDEAKVTALLEEKVGLKRIQPKETNEKDNTEESLLEGVQADRDEAKTGQDGPELRTDSKEKGERKIRRHFLTILNNASLKEATKFMLENDFAYNVKSMERSLSRAKAYLEKNGMEDSYNNFITYGTQIEGLTGDESIALAFLMQTIINEAVVREVKAGNQEVADELYDEFYRLSEKLSVIGTESGRVVNAFNLFLLDMSNPISAQMALNRIARKAENKAKASDSKERKKAESKTKAVKSEVDKGKRKASREVAEFAEDITKEDSELGDIIFKGSKKPISDETKAKISNFFDSMKSKPKKSLASNNIQRPILWDPFVDSVKKSVIEDNTPLPKAIAKAYSELASTSDKKTLDSVRDAFVKEAGVSPEQVAKKIQAQKKKESERLQKEKDTLEKELQKERDRVAKLRAKEKESQQARIDEQSAKLQLQEAKEAQKAVEDKIEKDRVEKQKTLTQAKKEALKNELAAAKQKAKDAQKVLDLADKMALKTIQAELKEAQNKEKQLEKDIDKLGKELVRNRLFEDLVADLVDEYINMKGDTKNEDLIKLVEERLGVKGEKAVKIANKIRSSVYNNVTKRVSDRFERDIETEKKRLYGPEIVEAYEKMTGDEATKDKELLKLIEEKLKLTGEKANQVAKKVKEGTYGKKEPKSGEQIVDELVFAINSKMMTADMMMDLFPSKYGMVNFTAEDFQKVRELSQAIATAPSSERKAIAIKNFLEYLYSFKPYYFAELMNELWYFDVLSGVLTIGLQTGDVNNFYNFVQASAMAKEVPIVSALQSVRRAFEDKKIDYGVSALKDVLTGFKKGLIQTMVRPTANEVKTASAWIKFAFKNKAFLNESRSAFVESFLNGTASFTDFDNPFKNSALGEFDIRRVWDGARKNKSEGKKGLAYLYWLAMENVYNVGAAAYRFITPFVNKIVPQVGKTLAAQDLFFTGIIKNTYSPFVLREQLRKEGLRGAELEAELAKRLYITEEELASARYTATNWRMKYDIGFSQNEKGEWNIYDNGKVVKKFSLGRFKTMNFATLEEAEDYAKTVVAPSGSRYRLDVISQLNLKRGMEALKAEKRIASFNLLTKASMGYTGTLLSALNSASNWLTKQSETISESASLKDSRAMRYGLNILATSVIYATHLFSFLKVGTGLARMFSQYYTPIGLARAVRADLQNKSLLGKELDENISKTEIDMLYAKALLGLIPTYFAAGMAQRLAELIKDDEDKDEEKKEVELTAQEKKFLELIEKKNGIKLTNEQKKVLTLVKPGDVVGNLQWMEAGMRRFYTNNKILVESSEFLGYDEQGNRMWSSLSAYPNYILAESIATAAWYMYFNKDNKESNPVTQFVLNPLYKFIDLSIGQGIVKYFASKTSTENKLEALAQTIVFDQLGVFNPNLLSGVMKYVDGKARKNENIFDYIDNQEDGIYPTAIGAYTLDKVVPLKGAWYEATQAPIVYGQFGEEIFRVPAEKQGYISAAIGYYKNKDKNPEQKAMNEYFLSIGINKLYVPDKSPIIDENFKPHKLTPRQRDEFGMLAGRVSFSQFKKLTPLIQEVYSKVSEKAAGDMVNKVFVSNYKNMAAFKLGLITQKDFDRLSTENIASVIVKAVKSMNQSVLSEDVLEALEITKEEKDFMENMKKVSGEDNKRAIFLKQMNQLKDETEMSDYLVRMYQLKIMSENMFNNLYNYKYLNGTIGANIPERIEEEENQEEEE